MMCRLKESFMCVVIINGATPLLSYYLKLLYIVSPTERGLGWEATLFVAATIMSGYADFLWT